MNQENNNGLSHLLIHVGKLYKECLDILDYTVVSVKDEKYLHYSQLYSIMYNDLNHIRILMSFPLGRMGEDMKSVQYADITNISSKYLQVFKDAGYMFAALTSFYTLLDRYYVDGRYATLNDLYNREFGDKK